ncbi:DUF2321 domain-containing protein [Roseomonas sp. M0104]|uniref:DUF2321 domain-containing protein n=1 Tax=Teichococcus coralli TaxID=2545983 RepID=A0A845B573_9PROT|nr:DUF2321 domain-containing protein [Pseudoroseomonas coralli]MXP62783.1 DUF2321 domain-containing protein [Pseudoroseomonas coralli]
MREGYDVMQVCVNGHQINSSAQSMPQFNQPFCDQCGAETITACPECRTPIPGYYYASGVLSVSRVPVPNNCTQCGVAYPWRQATLASAVEIFELELDGQDASDAAALLPLIASDNPRTEVAALKLKRLMSKMAKPAYDITIKVISDLASETAKKTFGMKP